jgi:prepilin-type N-terminal cleavage/methylation domain-containing protein
MRTHSPPSLGRRGVTLIELLVVLAIIGALAVAVLPNVSNTAEARRGREAARMVSSFIAKAHSRAIGRREPAGFMVATAGPGSFAAVDLFLADVPSPYRGDTVDATLSLDSTPHPSVSTWRSGTIQPSMAIQSGSDAGVRPYDLIRFAGRGPHYEIVSFVPSAVTIRLRGSGRFGEADFTDNDVEDVGQVLANTPWPAPEPLPFEIFRQPQPSGSPLSLDGGRAIDLFWSGYGPPRVDRGTGTTVTATYRRFTTAGSRISIVFDGTGRLRQIVEATPAATNRRAVTGAVFLLAGRVDRVAQPSVSPSSLKPDDDTLGANWQYPDSWWVAIDPLTGMTKIAECRPGAATVEESQQWVREALLASGR